MLLVIAIYMTVVFGVAFLATLVNGEGTATILNGVGLGFAITLFFL